MLLGLQGKENKEVQEGLGEYYNVDCHLSPEFCDTSGEEIFSQIRCMEEGGGRGQGGGGAGAGGPLQGKAGGQVGLRWQARPARGQAGGDINEKERKEGEMRKETRANTA